MIKLEKLKELLTTGILLSKVTFSNINIDFILDKRDSGIFNGEWMRNYYKIKQEKGLYSLEIKEMIDLIREISYKTTYNTTHSPELAGYISDDFGLIADALVLRYSDDWLNALTNEYIKDRIPYEKLKPIKGELSDIFFKL